MRGYPKWNAVFDGPADGVNLFRRHVHYLAHALQAIPVPNHMAVMPLGVFPVFITAPESLENTFAILSATGFHFREESMRISGHHFIHAVSHAIEQIRTALRGFSTVEFVEIGLLQAADQIAGIDSRSALKGQEKVFEFRDEVIFHSGISIPGRVPQVFQW